MPMSPRLLRPRQTIHAETADWANRVRTNGGSVSGTTLSAVDKLVRAIHNNGLRSLIYRANAFCGTGLAAALTPLFRGPSLSGTQYGSSTDTNTGGLFVAADYVETGSSGGLTGDGSTKYLDTGFPMNTLPSTTSGHASVYCRNRSATTTFRGMVGVGLAAGNGFGIATDATVYGEWGAFANAANTTNGMLVASRTSSTSLTTYVAGSSIATNTTSTTPTASALNAAVFVSRNSAAGHSFHDNRAYGFYSIGTGLTAAQVTALTNAVNAFQSALGRA